MRYYLVSEEELAALWERGVPLSEDLKNILTSVSEREVGETGRERYVVAPGSKLPKDADGKK